MRDVRDLQRELKRAQRDRDREVRELRAAGQTLAAIAKRYGISHQRVHQIVNGQ